MGGIGTQAVGGAEAREGGMVLPPWDQEPHGGLAFARMLPRPLICPNRCGHARHHCPLHGMEPRRAQPLVVIHAGTVAGDLPHTRCAGEGLGGKSARALECHARGPGARHAIDASAWPRCSGQKTLVHNRRREVGDTGSRRARLGVAHGTCPRPESVSPCPAARCVRIS